jgi:3-oxoacyl-[acyl-carrier protein] reductase
MRLGGKVALVTGAGSGMGAAIARLFGAEGARVALVDLDDEAARSAAVGIEGSISLHADVASSSDVDAAFEAAAETLGPIDVVVHAAGLDDRKTKAEVATGSGAPRSFTMEMSDEQWHQSIRVNLDGTFFVVRAALRGMVPRRSGSIVTVSSIGGITGCFMVNYCAAKGGVLAFTRSVAREVWDMGIRVNSIAPGSIDTPMLRRNPLVAASPPPGGRFGRPEEVATTALFLATDDSSYITGETIVVSGPLLTI